MPGFKSGNDYASSFASNRDNRMLHTPLYKRSVCPGICETNDNAGFLRWERREEAVGPLLRINMRDQAQAPWDPRSWSTDEQVTEI